MTADAVPPPTSALPGDLPPYENAREVLAWIRSET